MIVAHVVAKFLEAQGLTHVFGVNGGANLWLIHGIVETSNVRFIPTTHECNAGFAADAYARLTGLGCATATSGPGATNLVTAIAASYYDSVPVLYLTGNVASFRFGAQYGVRQYGFQETPIVDMVRGITKYAVQVDAPYNILVCLEEAVYWAKEGRKGPVLVDICDDYQRADVAEWDGSTASAYGAMYHFAPPNPKPARKIDVGPVVKLLQEARRPIFVWGAGIRPYAEQARALARSLGVPVACTWGAIDTMPSNDPLMCGGFGTHGTRAANFAVQNSDLIVSIGSRLDTKATAKPSEFARAARIVMVDIDQAEIHKFAKLGRTIDVGICADAGEFIEALAKHTSPNFYPVWDEWEAKIFAWRKRYDTPVVPWPGINPYELVKEIAKYTTKEDLLCSDTGTALGYLMQGYPFKGERFLHSFNMTPMGYGLPAAIGAAFANSGKRIILVTGDGSAMMSLAELATVARWNLNIKIILLNNGQHSMCVNTERQWFGGRNAGTTPESGLSFPSWPDIPYAFRIPAHYDLAGLFEDDGPGWHEVIVPREANLMSQTRFGYPIEDMEPPLPREELKAQMLVETV